MGNCRLRSFICCTKSISCSQRVYNRFFSFTNHIIEYCYDLHNRWLFVSGHTIPVQYDHITNDTNNEWIYHSTTNALSYYKERVSHTYTIGWLSARLIVDTCAQHLEYDLDDFLSTFTIGIHHTNTLVIPSLPIIISCWSIQSKQWFPTDAHIMLRVIDANGDEQTLTMQSPVTIRIQHHK